MIIALLLVYTTVLLALGRLSKRRVTNQSEQFLDGGRTFGFWHVFTLVTAMWCSWMVSVELETGFLQGISAVWFGASIIVMSILVATFLLTPFRKIGYLTNSNLVGRRFGKTARDISAIVIGITFPIFAMSNVLAAAAFIHVIFGWPLWITLLVSTMVILLYVSMNGLWSLAYTQIANLIVMVAGIGIAAIFALHGHPVFHTIHVPNAKFTNLFGVGPAMILVWFTMNILNSVSAQAEFQTIAAVKDPRTGRRAVYASSIVLVFFAVLPVLLGMATREYLPHVANGFIAFPMFLKAVAPNWAIALIALGFWASALTWCAPLLFSGASSFGLDLFNRKGSQGNAAKIRSWTRWSLILQGAFVIFYALIRPDQIAWWQVFGLTIRNAAIVAPTIVFLLWPVVQSRTVIVSMIVGVVSGLGWNAATGFSATVFLFRINPMWVGTGLSFIVIIVGTLVFSRSSIGLTSNKRRRTLGTVLAIVGIALFILSGILPSLALLPLLGPALFTGLTAWFFSLISLIEERNGTSSTTTIREQKEASSY